MKKKESPKNGAFFRTIFKKKLIEMNKMKKFVEPTVEFSDIEEFIENFNYENQKKDKTISDDENDKTVLGKPLKSFNRIPPPDKLYFDEWRINHKSLIFEKNYEIWKQFHICLKSKILLFVIDGRNPKIFYEEDVEIYNKNIIILVNKADLLSVEDISRVENFFKDKKFLFYSTKGQTLKEYNNKILSPDELNDYLKALDCEYFGIIGYPNVGKSSVINSLKPKKKAKISSTPGKTKFSQIWHISNGIKLLDCPGLVFPRYDKSELLLNGVINVDQSKLKSFEYEIISKIGVYQILKFFKIEKEFKNDSRNCLIDNFYDFVSRKKGWDRTEVLKRAIKLKFTEKLGKRGYLDKNIEKDFSWMSLK